MICCHAIIIINCPPAIEAATSRLANWTFEKPADPPKKFHRSQLVSLVNFNTCIIEAETLAGPPFAAWTTCQALNLRAHASNRKTRRTLPVFIVVHQKIACPCVKISRPLELEELTLISKNEPEKVVGSIPPSKSQPENFSTGFESCWRQIKFQPCLAQGCVSLAAGTFWSDSELEDGQSSWCCPVWSRRFPL